MKQALALVVGLVVLMVLFGWWHGLLLCAAIVVLDEKPRWLR